MPLRNPISAGFKAGLHQLVLCRYGPWGRVPMILPILVEVLAWGAGDLLGLFLDLRPS
jgi:hypothetical protein